VDAVHVESQRVTVPDILTVRANICEQLSAPFLHDICTKSILITFLKQLNNHNTNNKKTTIVSWPVIQQNPGKPYQKVSRRNIAKVISCHATKCES